MSEPKLTARQILAAKDVIPAYFDENTGGWYLANRWPDGDAGWAVSWSIWDEDAGFWNGVEEESVPEHIVDAFEYY